VYHAILNPLPRGPRRSRARNPTPARSHRWRGTIQCATVGSLTTESRKTVAQKLAIAAGPLAFALIAFVPSALHRLEGYGRQPALAAGVFAWMAVWWLTEAVPISLTACLPLPLFPLAGLTGKGFGADLSLAGAPFLDAYIFLFLGGMALGAAMEDWQLHRRLALNILIAVGTNPKRILFGMILSTALVSMWISNTATAVMMLPIAMALLAQLEASSQRRLTFFGTGLMLAVAYGANLGGVGTKIGTAVNSVFAGFLSEKLHYELSFLQYLALGVPLVVLFLPVVWAALWTYARHDKLEDTPSEVISRELAKLGPMKHQEKTVAAIFVAAALLWIFGDVLRPLLVPWVPRFWDGFKFVGKHYEALVAMSAALALLLTRTLTFRALLRLPYGTLLLLGGSFALAAGLEGSGLSAVVAQKLLGLATLPLLAQLGLSILATVFLSAVVSNTATVNVMLNVLPRTPVVLVACGLAASFDFALPAGTPPNAIVFGSGYIRLPVMMRIGVVLDLAAALFLTLYSWGYLRFVLP
jgi:solute carrier family 13 (sodium-dependent dicarboxylate transporter), member 2/3/5